MGSHRPPTAVVVGSGLAGLTSALELAGHGWHVRVVTPGRAGRDGATHRVHALAPWILLTAPWSRGDSPDRLCGELKRRSAGLERDGLAEVFAEEAHGAGQRLIEMLDLELLDGHPVCLPGDEIPRGLRCRPRHRHVLLAPLLRACTLAGVEIVERCLATALVTLDGGVTGIVVLNRESGRFDTLATDAVVLACGGPGAIFPVSTGPRWCRGSGLALAANAGALLHRPGLTQALPVIATPPLFFPTSDAILGGRLTVDSRTLPAPDLESATREIALAIRRGERPELEPHNGIRSFLPASVRASEGFRRAGRLPLTVALHHGIGGVAIDSWGRTSMPRLFACGEAAGGVQGRRRTMGTGLLEACIFGQRAASAATRDFASRGPASAGGEAPLPAAPEEAGNLERRMDELMGPLVALREAELASRAVAELKSWPTAPRWDERSVVAGIRRTAAVAVLSDAGKG